MIQTQTPLRVLITNNAAADRSGSDLFVRDLAIGLLARGYRPVVYSTKLGEVAELLRRITVPVVDDLEALGFIPDVIHGQHHLEAMTAISRFPDVPAIYFCHGWLPWQELPPVHPAIRRYVAVDDLCAERLLTTAGVDPSSVETIYNGVDMDRFATRPPLPEKPRTALIFSNYATAGGYSEAIRAACQRFGIERVDVAGAWSGQLAREPETLLPKYDLVFGKGRCALEAMAVGCATIVADFPGLAGLVCMDNLQRFRHLNFGIRTMQAGPINEDAVFEQLCRYDPADAAKVSAWIRANASFASVVDSITGTYRRALDQGGAVPRETAARATASYLKSLAARLKTLDAAELQAAAAKNEIATLRSQLKASHARIAGLESTTQELDALADKHKALEQAYSELENEHEILAKQHEQVARDHDKVVLNRDEHESELAAIHASRSWRALSFYRRLRTRLT